MVSAIVPTLEIQNALDAKTHLNLIGQKVYLTWFKQIFSNSFYHGTNLPCPIHIYIPSFSPSSLLPSFLLFVIFPGCPLTSKTIHNCEPLQVFNEDSDIIKFAFGIQQEKWVEWVETKKRETTVLDVIRIEKT